MDGLKTQTQLDRKAKLTLSGGEAAGKGAGSDCMRVLAREQPLASVAQTR